MPADGGRLVMLGRAVARVLRKVSTTYAVLPRLCPRLRHACRRSLPRNSSRQARPRLMTLVLQRTRDASVCCTRARRGCSSGMGRTTASSSRRRPTTRQSSSTRTLCFRRRAPPFRRARGGYCRMRASMASRTCQRAASPGTGRGALGWRVGERAPRPSGVETGNRGRVEQMQQGQSTDRVRGVRMVALVAKPNMLSLHFDIYQKSAHGFQ